MTILSSWLKLCWTNVNYFKQIFLKKFAQMNLDKKKEKECWKVSEFEK